MPFAPIHDQNIFFEDNQGSGQPIVFMHGFLMDQSLFDPQVKELSPKFRCIRWDARGFGKTQFNEKPFTLEDSVQDCFGLMDFLELESAILVGMSQGGYTALRAALHSPKRVKGLVLMSTQASVDPEPAIAGYNEMRDTWFNHGPVEPLLEGLATAILGPIQVDQNKTLWDLWLPKWKQTPRNHFYHATNCLTQRNEINHRMSEISCPTLVTHGSEDFAIPVSVGENLSKSIQNCKGFITAPGAHAVNLTHPEIINPPLSQFLSEFDS